MQKKIFTTLSLFLYILLSSFNPQENATLRVEVSNFENKPSTKIWVSVFNEKDFLKKSIQTKSVNISGTKAVVEFTLPAGEYAVSTYQDINNNGKLDRYIIGKPKEPYGFSNNVKPFGPPAYKACKFTLTNNPQLISISLIN